MLRLVIDLVGIFVFEYADKVDCKEYLNTTPQIPERLSINPMPYFQFAKLLPIHTLTIQIYARGPPPSLLSRKSFLRCASSSSSRFLSPVMAIT
jgi:hypothetical protein